MKTRSLGKNNLSALGFGCMRLPVLGGDEGRINEPLATRMLHAGIEKGINYVDTAYPYHRGNSEPFVGRALSGGFRERVHLATKLPSWAVQAPSDFDKYLNEQLKRLQTDHIDYYLVHALNAGSWQKLERMGILDFLDRAVRDGRILHSGFSFHDEAEAFKPIVDANDWEFCQIQYNYMDEMNQAGTDGLKYAAQKGLGVIVMEPLRGGQLAKGVPEDIRAIWGSSEKRRSPAEWALRWVWNHPEVSLALSGMGSLEEVEENCRIASEASPNSLSREEFALFENVQARYLERIKVPCTACGYCQPCPQGVNIPKVFGLFNETFTYGTAESVRRFYSNFMPPNERASNCVECGLCEKACPQHIRVMETLRESHLKLAGSVN
ncbi:MAG TPA: aldo/keto reductase [Cyanobacteria bacterium UBA8530]|nr:aldo/keto reductase [Cyanobacteria bacterium UBA8530]